MDENNVNGLENPGAEGRDALTDVLRQGAWRMLAQTVEEEVEAFVAAHEHITDEEGRRQDPGRVWSQLCSARLAANS